ncbi:MAG TPA: hypothetical protein VKR61_19080 [Bryobacteraceae bacterium]|nr:hypothetical protein [Bryobacteraceae bacterium]
MCPSTLFHKSPELFVRTGPALYQHDYNPVSRRLPASYLETRKDSTLARLVKPRRPYRPGRGAPCGVHHNIDPHFSNVPDVLMMADLRRARRSEFLRNSRADKC